MPDRVYNIDIVITAREEWLFKNNPIINKDVLAFFKKGLRKDTKGFYIKNTFKNLSEKAYLKEICNFPLFVKDIEIQEEEGKLKLNLFLDSRENLKVEPTEIYISSYDDSVIFALLKERGNIPARLSKKAMLELSEYIKWEKEAFYVQYGEKKFMILTRSIQKLLPHYLLETNF